MKEKININMELTPLEFNSIQVAIDSLIESYIDGDNNWWRNQDVAPQINAMKNVKEMLKIIRKEKKI